MDAITSAGGRALARRCRRVGRAGGRGGGRARGRRARAAPVVLVNNAGITRDNLIFKMSEDDWDSVLRVHLRGAFLMSRAAQAFMTKAGWGRIVNLSSTSALGNRGQANYAAAKAGMQGLTKTLAIELGRFGVTANAIAPGFIVTEMTRITAERLGVDFEEFQAGPRQGDARAAGRAARGHRARGLVLRQRRGVVRHAVRCCTSPAGRAG